jgi:hypothetical protein
MFVPIAPAILASLVVMVASAGPPNIDVQKTCRAAEVALNEAFGDETKITVNSCALQENAARDQLAKNWATYPVADKTLCVQPKSYSPSYAEWLTCLELQRDVRKIRADEPAAAAPNRRPRGPSR